MARIAPVPDVTGQTARLPTPYEHPFATAQGEGAGFGDVLQQGAAVAHDFQQEHKRQTAARVMKTVGEFGEQADLLLHDPNGGALNLEGETALGAYNPTVKKLRELQTKTSQGLSDENQRSLFMEHSEGVLRTAQRQLEVHTSTQGQKLKTDGLLSTQKSMLDSSVKAIDQTSADAYTATAAAATRAYWGEHRNQAVAEEKAREYIAIVNAGRLDRLLANPATQGDAIRFFQSRHDALPADKLDTYEAKVAAVGDAAKADAEAIRISNESLQRNGQVDRRAAQAQIDELPAGPMKDHVQARVDHRASVFDAAWRDERDLIAGKVADQMTDPVTGEMNSALANAADMKALELKDPVRAAAMKKGAAVAGAKSRYAQAYDYFFGSPAARERTAQMSADEFRTDPMVLQLQPRHKLPIVQMFDATQKNIRKQAPPEALVMEEARNVLKLGQKKIGELPSDKQEKLTDLFISVQDEMRDFVVHHDGQTPDKEKVREIIRGNLQVTAAHWLSPDELRFQAGAADRRRRRTQPAAPVATPTPTTPVAPAAVAPTAGGAKAVRAYRYNKTNTVRIPVFSDGTEGPQEPNP